MHLWPDAADRPREWLTYKYIDPTGLLVDLNKLANGYIQSGKWRPDELAAVMRTREMREYFESRQAALFCHGMSSIFGTPVRPHLWQVARSSYLCAMCWPAALGMLF